MRWTGDLAEVHEETSGSQCSGRLSTASKMSLLREEPLSYGRKLERANGLWPQPASPSISALTGLRPWCAGSERVEVQSRGCRGLQSAPRLAGSAPASRCLRDRTVGVPGQTRAKGPRASSFLRGERSLGGEGRGGREVARQSGGRG